MTWRLTILWALAFTSPYRLQAVTPVPAGALVQHPASYFNLEQKLVRFTPSGASTYNVAVTAAGGLLKQGSAIAKSKGRQPNGRSWRVRLKFSFPFAGKKWDELYVNTNGNLTFGAP